MEPLTDRAQLEQLHVLIRTDAYLDAHPALCHALCQALEHHIFKVHRFAYNPESRVFHDWCDPHRRRAMEQAFEDVQNRRPKA